MAKKKNKELSQAEIWDDSALLQSWNDALAEYKLYHSIHARGERVEDIVREVEANGNNALEDGTASAGNATNTEANGAMAENLEDGELEEEPEDTELQHSKVSRGEAQVPSTSQAEPLHPHSKTHTVEQQCRASGIPSAVMASVKDEALKNLMMSWYYAGYYTGFYEGQQAQHSVSE